MSTSMLDLLKRQRNFFIAAIVLTITQNLVNNIIFYSAYGRNTEEFHSLFRFLDVVSGIINVVCTVAMCAYGVYMGKRGFLKKYVVYFYVIYLVWYLIKCVLSWTPQFQAMYSGWSAQERTLYHACSGILAWIVIIFSAKGSLMNGWMKWGIGVGYIVFSWFIGVIPTLLFSEAEMDAHPLRTFFLSRDIAYYLMFIVGGLGIYAYYNYRIKKAEKTENEVAESYS